jgi:hypothetical protein
MLKAAKERSKSQMATNYAAAGLLGAAVVGLPLIAGRALLNAMLKAKFKSQGLPPSLAEGLGKGVTRKSVLGDLGMGAVVGLIGRGSYDTARATLDEKGLSWKEKHELRKQRANKIGYGVGAGLGAAHAGVAMWKLRHILDMGFRARSHGQVAAKAQNIIREMVMGPLKKVAADDDLERLRAKAYDGVSVTTDQENAWKGKGLTGGEILDIGKGALRGATLGGGGVILGVLGAMAFSRARNNKKFLDAFREEAQRRWMEPFGPVEKIIPVKARVVPQRLLEYVKKAI